jgi:hypothetical protein
MLADALGVIEIVEYSRAVDSYGVYSLEIAPC